MPKIKIISVINKDEISKNGKSYCKCSIKTIDKNGNELWINGWGNNVTKSWVKGQEVELDCYKEEYQGKDYWKFKDVAEKNIFTEIERLEGKIDRMVEMLAKGAKTSPRSILKPTEDTGEVSVEDCERIFGQDPETPVSDIPDFLR